MQSEAEEPPRQVAPLEGAAVFPPIVGEEDQAAGEKRNQQRSEGTGDPGPALQAQDPVKGSNKRMRKGGAMVKRISPYFAFTKQQRETAKAELLAAGKGASASEVAKLLGAKWQALSDEEKKAYKVVQQDQINGQDENEEEDGEEVAEDASEGADELPGQAKTGLALPLSRVKKIVKLDKDIKQVSADGMRVICQATELFIEVLLESSLAVMLASKRRTIREEDVVATVKSRRRFRECIGDELLTPQTPPAIEERDTVKQKAAPKPKPPPKGTPSITSFFSNGQQAAACPS